MTRGMTPEMALSIMSDISRQIDIQEARNRRLVWLLERANEERDLALRTRNDCDVFLVEKAWVDELENHPSYAFGYRPVGFVATETEAKVVVETGGPAPQGWATPKNAYAYRYVRVPRFAGDPNE